MQLAFSIVSFCDCEDATGAVSSLHCCRVWLCTTCKCRCTAVILNAKVVDGVSGGTHGGGDSTVAFFFLEVGKYWPNIGKILAQYWKILAQYWPNTIILISKYCNTTICISYYDCKYYYFPVHHITI